MAAEMHMRNVGSDGYLSPVDSEMVEPADDGHQYEEIGPEVTYLSLVGQVGLKIFNFILYIII
jgi:hypothetical protein